MRKTSLVAAFMLLAACASAPDTRGAWTAIGFLTPNSTDNSEVIGEYYTETSCREAVEAWMSRQVVGNPVSGDCLPTDRH